ncbi:hypothetical protein NAD41_002357 [Salmonella enterica]|nr:hypothetical protein [Salmonella enterica]EKK6596325.1 hypothetical protein [Salmonella enterica]
MPHDLSIILPEGPLPPDYLPSIPEVVAVLKMCVDHDLPLEKLPGLWDKYQALEQVERRINIQNGNMDREIIRLRGLTSELDKQLADERQRVKELQEALNNSLHGAKHGNANQVELYRQRIRDMEQAEACLESQILILETNQRDQDAAMQEQADRYEALRLRCKHFEDLADPRQREALEDLVTHYREGMNGLKKLAQNPHFSNELRVDLMRRVLYVFEPELKITPAGGEAHA